MKKNLVIASFVLLAAATAAYFYWQHNQPISPQTDDSLSDTSEVSDTSVHPVLIDPPVKASLPQLSESDSFIMEALGKSLGDPALMKIFISKQFIQNMVTTIDNLPTMSAPIKVLPVEVAEGSFITSGSGSDLIIDPENTRRYIRYMQVVDAMDTKTLVQLYIQLYPLFQEAYEELGYPNRYFNERLIFVIDDLLATPDIKEPVKLVQPLVVYKYADPNLEARNIGQRTLMRIGSQNAAKVKSKLREIKQQLLLNMQEQKAGNNLNGT
jgi:Protein of unknown function (DUF3014)